MLGKPLAGAFFGLCGLVAALSACSGDDEATSNPGTGATAAGGSGALGTGGLGIAGTLGGGGLGIAGVPNFDGGLAGFGAFAGAGGGSAGSGGGGGISGSGGVATGGVGATGGNAGTGGAPVTCAAPMANCNAAPDCDTNLQQASNTCQSAPDLGAFCGDDICDVIFACWPVTWKPAKAAKGLGSRWLRAGAVECSTCVAETVGLVSLRSPPGTNYDIYVYASCGKLVGSSKKPEGVDDIIAVEQKEVSGPQAFDYWIEVRWVSGNSCQDWQLQIYRSGCPL